MIKFFLILLSGLILGTILHEAYHYFAALYCGANPEIILATYGIGIKSSYHSSELVAFSITGVCVLISFYIAVKNK